MVEVALEVRVSKYVVVCEHNMLQAETGASEGTAEESRVKTSCREHRRVDVEGPADESGVAAAVLYEVYILV